MSRIILLQSRPLNSMNNAVSMKTKILVYDCVLAVPMPHETLFLYVRKESILDIFVTIFDINRCLCNNKSRPVTVILAQNATAACSELFSRLYVCM